MSLSNSRIISTPRVERVWRIASRKSWADYRRLGHLTNTSWIEPSLTPQENNPMFRLPVLEPAFAGHSSG